MAAAEKPVLSRYRDRMDKAVAALKEEFGSLRTGRASASILDQVMVEAYGSTTPLNAVASVSVPEPRQINVSVWDRGVVVSVEIIEPVPRGAFVVLAVPAPVTLDNETVVEFANKSVARHDTAGEKVLRNPVRLVGMVEAVGRLAMRKHVQEKLAVIADPAACTLE